MPMGNSDYLLSRQDVSNPGRFSRYRSVTEHQYSRSRSRTADPETRALRKCVEQLSAQVERLESQLREQQQRQHPSAPKGVGATAPRASESTSPPRAALPPTAPAAGATPWTPPPPFPPPPPRTPAGAALAVEHVPLSAVRSMPPEITQPRRATAGTPPRRTAARPPSASPSAPGTRCAPYRSTCEDTSSVLSWSADAFGKSKTPGWYHVNRKRIILHKQWLASQHPRECFGTMTQYAEEAARINDTGRLAF